MRFHAVSRISTFFDTQIRAIHSSFFHGEAKRGGKFPTADDARLAFDVDEPLRLHKNAHDIADIFKPGHMLVVSERVAENLSTHSAITLSTVSFDVLYKYPYSVDDPSCGFDDYRSQMRFIDEQRDDPQLRRQVGQYFQIRSLPVFRIRELFPNAPLIEATIKRRSTQLPISEDVFAAHPLYSIGSSTIMSADVFQQLEPFFNWTYFAHAELGDTELA